MGTVVRPFKRTTVVIIATVVWLALKCATLATIATLVRPFRRTTVAIIKPQWWNHSNSSGAHHIRSILFNLFNVGYLIGRNVYQHTPSYLGGHAELLLTRHCLLSQISLGCQRPITRHRQPNWKKKQNQFTHWGIISPSLQLELW